MKWILAVLALAITHSGVYLAGHLNGVGGSLTVRPDAGRFLSDATLTQLDNELWAVRGDFVYVDPDGKAWLAPDGAKVNGASIPSALWQVVGPPLRGAYVKASIVHDVACEEQREPSDAVHRMFYYACLAGGLPEPKARMMFWGVQTFGPTWGVSAAPPVAPLPAPAVAKSTALPSAVASKHYRFMKRTYGVRTAGHNSSTTTGWSPPKPAAASQAATPQPAAEPEPPAELTAEAARKALAYFQSHADLPLNEIPDLGAKPIEE